MPYLEQYLDPALKVPEGVTKASITKEELERLNKLLAVATAAEQIPRRRGADADNDELRIDKLRCRRIAHVATQGIAAWGGKVNPKGITIGREAATVDWTRWCQEHTVWLRGRMVFVATWHHYQGKDERWAKSALVRLNNELSWIQYAMRD